MIGFVSLVAMTGYIMSDNLSPDPGNLDWSSARAHCQSLGMDLAVIKSDAEQAAFEQEAGQLYDTGAIHTAHLWLGAYLNDGGDPTIEEHWTWVDGTPLGTFANWVEHMPRGPGKCIEVYQRSEHTGTGEYSWGSGNCDGPRAFACSEVGGVKNLPPILPPQPRPPPPPPLLPPPAPPFPVSVVVVVATSAAILVLLMAAMHIRMRRSVARATASTTRAHAKPPQQAIGVMQPDGTSMVALGATA